MSLVPPGERLVAAGAAFAVLGAVVLLLAWDQWSARRPPPSGSRSRALPARPARLPRLLVAAAVSSQVTGLLVLGAVGGLAGYALGPAAARTRLLAVATVVPLVPVCAGAAAALFHVARWVPNVATATFGLAAAAHCVAALAGTGLALAGRPVAGGVLAVASLTGAVGYAYGVRVRARAAARGDRGGGVGRGGTGG